LQGYEIDHLRHRHGDHGDVNGPFAPHSGFTPRIAPVDKRDHFVVAVAK
jgi:hypothetical protein